MPPFRTFGDDAGSSGKDDDQCRRERGETCQYECCKEDQGAQLIYNSLLHHAYNRVQHQGTDYDPDARQGMQYDRHVDEILQDGSDQTDNDEGRGDHSQGAGYAADESGLLISYIGGGVDSDDSGGTLADGVDVQKLFFRTPSMFLYDLPLQHGQHGKPAAEGEPADFEKTDI